MNISKDKTTKAKQKALIDRFMRARKLAGLDQPPKTDGDVIETVEITEKLCEWLENKAIKGLALNLSRKMGDPFLDKEPDLSYYEDIARHILERHFLKTPKD